MPDESLAVIMDVKEEVKIPVAIELAKWHAKSITLEAQANDATVTDDEEDALCTSARSKVKAFFKEVEEAKKLHIAPFEKYVYRIRDMFSPISGSAIKAEALYNQKILAYRQDKERKVKEEQARLEAERQKALREIRERAELEGRDATPKELELPFVPPPPKVQATVKSGTARSTVVRRWKARVVDPKAVISAIMQGRIPIEMVEFNMKWANEKAREAKKAQVVDGIEYFEDQSLAG